MAWCKVSSLTAAVVRSLKGMRYPATRREILDATRGKLVEGWEISHFLESSLKRQKYGSLKSVMSDLESWLEVQG